MSTAYYVETIERITEQMLVEEVLDETENIKTDTIEQVDKIKDAAIDYITKQQRDLINKLAETGIRKELRQIDSDTTAIYNDIQKIVQNTDAKIENTIRNKIVSNGYSISLNNDGSGNVAVVLGRTA
jgi:hypothetical protein